jgi:hypothetical protein
MSVRRHCVAAQHNGLNHLSLKEDVLGRCHVVGTRIGLQKQLITFVITVENCRKHKLTTVARAGEQNPVQIS